MHPRFLPLPHLLRYADAILRVFNRFGRRDNIHKARIKIAAARMRASSAFAPQVEEELPSRRAEGDELLLPPRRSSACARTSRRRRTRRLAADTDVTAGARAGFPAW